MLFCLPPLRTQQSFNKWGLLKLNFAVHKNTGKFASLTKRARSTSFLLISSFNILLRFKKREKKARNRRFSRFQTSVPSCANFLCTFVCLALPNTVTKLFNQIWVYDVTGVAYFAQRAHNHNTSNTFFEINRTF